MYAADYGTPVLKYRVNIGLRRGFGQGRLATSKIPPGHPIMCEPLRQIARRTPAYVPQLAGRQWPPQDSPSPAHFRIEEFFDFGGRPVSRFSNHRIRTFSIFFWKTTSL